MKLKVGPSTLSGCITAPPSKSHSMRAILFASLATGTSQLRNLIASPDTEAMIAGCQQLGAKFHFEHEVLHVEGFNGSPHIPADVINAGNSGQVLRFIACLAALSPAYTIITGDHSIRHNRPVQPLIAGFPQLAAQCISSKNDGFAPIIVKGPMQSGRVKINGQDSQPISGLIIASAFTDGITEIFVEEPGETPWVDLTLSWFDFLKLSYDRDGHAYYKIPGKQSLNSFNYHVPADFSSMAFPLAAALITGSKLSIDNADMSDSQGDKKIIPILQALGANIQINHRVLTVNGTSRLRGGEIDVNDIIDALPILTVIACFAEGITILKNAAIARAKESDRLSAITQELRKMGANIIEEHDRLIITAAPLHAADLQAHHDHRIAMALSVAALSATGISTIHEVECISKSYKNFVDDFKQLGANMDLMS